MLEKSSQDKISQQFHLFSVQSVVLSQHQVIIKDTIYFKENKNINW